MLIMHVRAVSGLGHITMSARPADTPWACIRQNQAQGCFRRSGPWGFRSGPGCGTITAIVSQTGLRILRDVPSGKPWPVEDTRRTRRGWMLLSRVSHMPRTGRLRPPRRHGKPVTVVSTDMPASREGAQIAESARWAGVGLGSEYARRSSASPAACGKPPALGALVPAS
jgi:hypothetical protein